MSDIETLDSTVVYENKWMRVREDRIRRASGAEGIYGVVDKPDCVVVLPVDQGEIHLVEQFRYPVGARHWELPQGAWEGRPDAEMAKVAAGELREETGLVAGSMLCLGDILLCNGFLNQRCFVFLATSLERVDTYPDPEEEDLITAAFALDRFNDMIARGEIKDSTTLSAVALAKVNGAL